MTSAASNEAEVGTISLRYDQLDPNPAPEAAQSED